MAEPIISKALTPEQLAAIAKVDLMAVKTEILSGRLRYIDGIIPKSECLRYLVSLGKNPIEQRAGATDKLPIVAPVNGPYLIRADGTEVEPIGAVQIAGVIQPTDPLPDDPAEKAEQLERARIGQIADLLAKLVPIRRIIRTKSDEWKISQHMVKSYVEKAYTELNALSELGKEARRDQYRDAMSEVLQECMADAVTYDREGNIRESGPRDLKAAIAAIDKLIKLDGCYPAENKRVTVETPEAPSNPDKIRERIAELMKNPQALARAAEVLTQPETPTWSDRVDNALELKKISGDDVTGTPETSQSSDQS